MPQSIVDVHPRSVPSHQRSRAHCSGFVAGLSSGKSVSPLVVWGLFIVYTCLSSATVEAKPLSDARWINPCDFPEFMFNPTTGLPVTPANANHTEIIMSLKRRGTIALEQAKGALNTLVKLKIKDPALIEATASHRLQWLPKVDRAQLKNMTLKSACRYWYWVLQFYGVALEQVITDEVVYGGDFLASCRAAENNLTQLLCQLQMASMLLRVRPDPDVMRDVMSQKYRTGTESTRLFRNYMIFRDYAEALTLMTESFDEIEARTLSESTLQSTPPNYPLPNLFKRSMD